MNLFYHLAFREYFGKPQTYASALDIKMSGDGTQNDYDPDDPKTWIAMIMTNIIIIVDVFSCE